MDGAPSRLVAPRRATDAVWVHPSGRAWVRPSRHGAGFTVHVAGLHTERSRPTLADARRLAEDLLIDRLAPSGDTPVWKLLDSLLVAERPVRWSEAWAERQRSVARTWLQPLFGVRARDLRPAHIDGVIQQLREAQRGPDLEDQLRRLWASLEAYAKRVGAVSPERQLAPKLEPRVRSTERVAGDALITRADLPSWAQIETLAAKAADLTGIWWEELRIMWLATTGMRWGEHASLTTDDLDLAAGAVTISWAMRTVGSTCYELRSTKMGPHRRTLWPAALDELVRRRVTEAGPGALLFPGTHSKGPATWQEGLTPERVAELTRTPKGAKPPEPRTWVNGTWAQHSSWTGTVWLRAGEAAGWPVKARRRAANDHRATSLVWHPHDLRHVAATWLLDAPGEQWWHGAGMSLADVAACLGDSEDVITRWYRGTSPHVLGRLGAAIR